MKPPAMILGIPIDPVTMDEAVAEIERLVDLGRRRSSSHQVVTVNVDFVVNAIGSPVVMRILQRADLDLADGMPLVWAAGKIGVPIPERVTGADLVPALAARSASTGLRIHFFGSKEGVAEQARDLLVERYPGALITAESGPIIADPTAPDDAVVASLTATGADVVCVALGNPKQEHFIAAVRDRIDVPVLIGIGGTLDLLVGVHTRAPGWMQRAGLEWIFRALQEPRRLGKRYLKDIFVFGPRLARFLWHARRLRRSSGLGQLRNRDNSEIDRPGTIDLRGVELLPIVEIGRLAAARRASRQEGAPLSVTGAGRSLARSLASLGAEGLLVDERTV